MTNVTTRGKSGRCISEDCPVGESTFEEARLLFIAVQKHNMFTLHVGIEAFKLCVCGFSVFFFFSFSRYEKTLPKTNEAKPKSPLELPRARKGGRYEWGGCGVLGVAKEISS